MAEKSVDERIADKKQELEVLEREKQKGSHQEFPKSVVDPKDPTKSYTVQNAEQEAAVRKGLGASDHAGKGIAVGNTFDLTTEEQEAQKNAKAEADKDAAHAKSRLAGPEPENKAAQAHEAKKAADYQKEQAAKKAKGD